MAHPSQLSDDERTIREDLDEVLSRANPNPARTGCPPRQTLIELAARARAVGDPAYSHLSNCSECYREFRILQDAPTLGGAAARATRKSGFVAAAALAGLAVASSAIWVAARLSPTPVAVSQPTAESLHAELDLRKFAVMRSAQAVEPPEPVRLPVGLLEVTLLLPVGSEAGEYDIQLLDSELKTRAVGRGAATIEDFVATIRATIDLRGVQEGNYQLAVRRHGDDWRTVPARVYR